MTAAASPMATEVRPYFAAAAGAAVVMVLALAQRGDASLAMVPLAFAALGLLLRRTSAPIIAVAIVVYLLIFPYGVPRDPGPIYRAGAGFALADVVVVAAVLTYLLAQFRLFSLTLRAVPNEKANLAAKLHDAPIVRPAPTLVPDELFRLGALVAFAVVAGQVLWFAATRFEIRPDGLIPLFYTPEQRRGDWLQRGAVPLLLLGLPALSLRFYFWVKRHRSLSQDEARLAVLDTAWAENRRELARLETWRAWGRGARPGGKFPWKFVLLLALGTAVLGCAYAVIMGVVESLLG
jgi:hypothetical protein